MNKILLVDEHRVVPSHLDSGRSLLVMNEGFSFLFHDNGNPYNSNNKKRKSTA